jgi:hypothetical protein
LAVALLVAQPARGQQDCPSCCGGLSYDWINIWLIAEIPLQPPFGLLQVGILDYITLEDGCDEPLEFLVKRECSEELVLSGGPGPLKGWSCAVFCGWPVYCPDDGCYGCPDLYTHGCAEYSEQFFLAGDGVLIARWKGQIVFSESFDFGGEPDFSALEFTDIRFLNKDYSEIQTNDIFDAMEEVAIQVDATFDGNEPPP